MRHWTFWDWIAYGGLFIAAMILAADTGIKIAPDLGEHLPFIHGVLWGASPLVLLLLASGILLVRNFIAKDDLPAEKVAPQATPGIVLPQAIPTGIRFQFHQDDINPDVSNELNIYSWYALRYVTQRYEKPSKQHKEGRILQARSLFIFLVFTNPVAIKQILVRGIGVNLPTTEVKNHGPRHAIIIISGDIGSAIVDIKVVV